LIGRAFGSMSLRPIVHIWDGIESDVVYDSSCVNVCWNPALASIDNCWSSLWPLQDLWFFDEMSIDADPPHTKICPTQALP
jgi:hypothetical protein